MIPRDQPEPCIDGPCRSPLACGGFGYCRNRNRDGPAVRARSERMARACVETEGTKPMNIVLIHVEISDQMGKDDIQVVGVFDDNEKERVACDAAVKQFPTTRTWIKKIEIEINTPLKLKRIC